ncbi:MAG: DUF4384 domain-containing protein [Desulfococcaceae bacterium]|jgi:hypothetical protein|nr:DUF4384 domain-containing protein [Desulfococcaceae bacterium]
MKQQWKQIIGTALAVVLAGLLVCPAGASEKGAKSLFYDPNASGTVQIAEPNAAGGSGAFTPSVSKVGPDGNPVNPVSNYYDNLNPGVMYWIELVRPGSGNVKRVSNDQVFRSGDRIRIHVTANSDGYLHVLHSGSSGASGIMPVSNTTDGSVQMGQDYVVPSNGGWLTFDSNPGKEKLKLVFASVKSSDDIINTMSRVAVQNASTAAGQLFAIYNEYRNSPNYVTQVQNGSKDLVVEGMAYAGYVRHTETQPPSPGYASNSPMPPQPAPYYYAPPVRFNTYGTQNFRPEPAVYNAPASYVVSRASGSVKEPVVLEITLNHHP